MQEPWRPEASGSLELKLQVVVDKPFRIPSSRFLHQHSKPDQAKFIRPGLI